MATASPALEAARALHRQGGLASFYRDVEFNLPRASASEVVTAARRIRDLAHRHPDPTLAVVSLAGEGYALAAAGEIGAGMGLLDEAMVALETDTVAPAWCGTIFCTAMEVAH